MRTPCHPVPAKGQRTTAAVRGNLRASPFMVPELRACKRAPMPPKRTPVRAVVRGRYKLVWHPYDHIEIAGARVTESTIRYMPQPRTELFDMESDPGEHENLADKYPEKVSELKSLLETWMKQTGAKALTPNPAYDASRPLFNTRDESLKQASEQKKAKK